MKQSHLLNILKNKDISTLIQNKNSIPSKMVNIIYQQAAQYFNISEFGELTDSFDFKYKNDFLLKAFEYDNIQLADYIRTKYCALIPNITVLKIAISSNNINAVNHVLSTYSIQNALQNDTDAAHILSEAIKTGVLDIYTLISSNIPDVNILINKTSVKDAIKYAVQNGDIPIISKLIEYENAKQNMNLVDALHNEKSEMAEFLIEKIDTLDYTITDHRGYSLLHLALEKIQNLSDRYYIINLLLNGNANVNAIGPNEDPVIYTAALIGDYNCFSLLKTKGAYFDVNNVLTSPILYAATIASLTEVLFIKMFTSGILLLMSV